MAKECSRNRRPHTSAQPFGTRVALWNEISGELAGITREPHRAATDLILRSCVLPQRSVAFHQRISPETAWDVAVGVPNRKAVALCPTRPRTSQQCTCFQNDSLQACDIRRKNAPPQSRQFVIA